MLRAILILVLECAVLVTGVSTRDGVIITYNCNKCCKLILTNAHATFTRNAGTSPEVHVMYDDFVVKVWHDSNRQLLVNDDVVR